MNWGQRLLYFAIIITISLGLLGCDQTLVDQPGILAIFANQVGAKVYINGEQIGVSPLHIEQPAGSYDIKVTYAGYVSWEQKIHLANGERLVLHAELVAETGSLRLQTLPVDATIEINNERYQAPVSLDHLQAGTYQIKIEKEFYQTKEIQVVIEAGEVTSLEVNLELQPPDPNAIRLETEALAARLVAPLQAKQARVAEISDNEVYLNKGLGYINVGEEYEIIGPGIPIYDPNNGDLIGHREQHRGAIQITRVRDNMSIGVAFTPTAGFAPGDLAYQVVDKKKVAVYRLAVPSRPDSLLAWTLQEALLTALNQYPEIEVVERQQLDQVIEELKLNTTGLIDAESMKGLGKILGVDAIVIGSITDLGTRLDLDLRLLETETARLIHSTTGTLQKDQHIQRLLEESVDSYSWVDYFPSPQHDQVQSRAGRTIRVPQDLPTIRQAIDRAQDGDVIVVAPGEYYDYVDFQGKAITIRSQNPAHEGTVRSTVLRAGPATATIVSFSRGEDNGAVLEGFTMMGSPRQAIFVSNSSSPIIRHNRFIDNKEGAITILANSSPVIANNHFEGNSASQFYFLSAGAIYIRDSAPTIRDNSFTNNTSARSGGAIYVDKNSKPTIYANTFTGNQAGGLGGGVIYVSKEAQVLGVDGSPWKRYPAPPYAEPTNQYKDNGKSDVYFQ